MQWITSYLLVSLNSSFTDYEKVWQSAFPSFSGTQRYFFEEVLRGCFPSCSSQQHCRQVLLAQTGKRGGGTQAKHTSKTWVMVHTCWLQHCGGCPVEALLAHRHFLWTAGEVWLWQEMGRNRTTRSQLLRRCFNCHNLKLFQRREFDQTAGSSHYQ